MMRGHLHRLAGTIIIILLCVSQRVMPSTTPQLPLGSTVEQCTAACPCDEPNDPDIRVVLTGGTATGGGGGNTYVDPGPGETLLTDPQFNDIGGSSNVDVIDGFQRMILEFEPVIASGAMSQASAPQFEFPWRDLWSALAGPVLEAAQPSKNPAAYVVLTSLGESQGTAFQMQIVNTGRRALRVAGQGLIVEPLKNQAAQYAQRQLANLRRGITNVKVNGYCIDMPLTPPSKGMIFRIANAATQKQFGSLRDVLGAAKLAHVTGKLNPDSNPASYADFVKQWSVWSRRDNWNESTFTSKFIEHTRKRAAEAGRPVTADQERVLRGAAPGRWRDIAGVLASVAPVAARK